MYEVFRWGCLCEGVVTDLWGAGDVPPGCDLGAIAEVDRKFRGLGVPGLARLGDAAEEGAGIGGICSCGLGVVEWPLLCADGGFELELDLDDGECDSFCDSECDRCRNARSDAFFLLS